MNRFYRFALGAALAVMLSGGLNAEEPAPAPEQNPAEQAPEQKPAETPAPAPAPEQKPAETPAPAPAPEQKPAETPAPAPAPEQKPAETPAPAPAPAPEKKTYKTFELKSVPLRVNVEAPAVVWAEEMNVLTLKPNSWAKFEIESVVPHGTAVKKGDVIVKFSREDYDTNMKDQTFELQLAEIAHERALLEQKVSEVVFQITEKNVNRKKGDRIAKWEQTQKYDLGLNLRAYGLVMESAVQTLENNKAELEQLQRMYEKDELVEQSEEIVLKRQRLTFRVAQLEYDRAVARNDWTQRMVIPRLEEEARDEFNQEMVKIDAEIAGLELTRKTMEIEKQKLDIQYQKTQKRYNELKEDAQWLELKAPCDGIAMYGALENGVWANYAKFAAALEPGTEVPVETSFLTVVNPANIFLKLTVAEGDFSKIAVKQNGFFVANSYPDVEIPAAVTEVSSVISGTEYAAAASVEAVPGVNLVPGLKGKVTVTAQRKSNALLVPESAIARGDDFQRYVYVLDEAKNEPVRHNVKVGVKLNGKFEILDGLAAGMKVLEDPASAE